MDSFDVLIVGGGPAGSTVAWGLRDSGYSVALLDKCTFPRDKVCAGWITPAVVAALELDLSDYARGRVLQPVHGFRIGVLGGPRVELRYEGAPVSYGIRRCEFDHYLLQRSKAHLFLGEAVRSLRRQGEAWLVNERLRARLVVGAGGHYCPVARSLGAKLGKVETVVAAQEVEFALAAEEQSCAAEAGSPELYFCPDLKGYGWVFRKGDYLNVGLGREDGQRLPEHVARFADLMRAQGRLAGGRSPRFKGHAYLLYDRSRRPFVAEGALLVGDAAGLAHPRSGEGILTAIESGLLAAQAIRAAAGDFGREGLLGYRQALIRRLGRRPAGAAAAMHTPLGLRRLLGRWLLGSRWFSRHVVIDRWFLHREQAPLSLS